MSERDEDEGPFAGGQDEPGDWLPGPFMDPADSKRPPSYAVNFGRKRRQYSKNGPLSKSMKCCLRVLARWGGR